MLRDADFMLAVLRESPGEWVSQAEILARSIDERGCGLTVHSRAATLRKRGLVVECSVKATLGGRRLSFYRLVSEPSLCESASPTRDAGADSQSEVVPEADGSQPPPRGATSLALFDAEEAERRAPAWA